MTVRSLIPALISISLFFASCEADINLHEISNEVSLHPELIFPIGSARVTLGKIISRNDSTGKFVIGTDNAEINYVNDNNYEFKFPVINFLENTRELVKNQYPSPTGVMLIPPNYTLPTISSNDSIVMGTNSDKNGDRIDSLQITSATVTVVVNVSDELKSVSASDMRFSIVFPKDKIHLADGSSSISFIPSGYGLVNTIVLKNFTMITSNGSSAIPVEIDVDAKSGDSPLYVSPTTVITSRINFTQLDYSVAYGIFKSGLSLPNTVEQHIDYGKDMPLGFVKPANPLVNITVVSNIGTFMNLKIDYIKAFLSSNLNASPIFASFDGNKYINLELKVKPPIPGDSISYQFPILDKNFGGTEQLFAGTSDPDMLQYNFSASVDSVLNNQTKTLNYITSDARIKVNIETIIPMDFTGSSYYEYRDSIPNLFALISKAFNKTPYVSSTALILNITNGLPVKTTFTFNLMDSVGKVIPTTFVKSYVVAAGKTDVHGIVQTGKETKQTLQITVDKDQLPALKRARSINYTVRIEGSDANSNIHFTKTNAFDLEVGLFVQGEINITLGTNTQK